jgi:hypothetical protein
MNNHKISNNLELSEIEIDIIKKDVIKKDFIKGQFLYIKDVETRSIIKYGYDAVNQLELWQYMKKYQDNYMYNTDIELNIIFNKIEELGYTGHSGFSFAWTLRQLQYISQKGEEEFMKLWITAN